jgi:hypothetical protein
VHQALRVAVRRAPPLLTSASEIETWQFEQKLSVSPAFASCVVFVRVVTVSPNWLRPALQGT